MKTILIVSIFLIVLIICAGGVYYFVLNDNNKNSESNNQILGGDKDSHGCIGSTGYTWNETKQECVREWEEVMKDACIAIGCPEESIYAGSKISDKYYECKCRWAKNVISENLICFSSDENAIADGRTKSEC